MPSDTNHHSPIFSARPPVAIVGIGGLFPRSPTLDDFWRNVVGGVDTASDIPAGRWPFPPESVYDPRPGTADRVYSLRGCFIRELPELPYFEGLNIRPEFAEQLDPLFRILLFCGHQAFQDGVTANLDRRRAGVIIGNIALPSEHSSALAWEYLGETFRKQIFEKYGRARTALDAAASRDESDHNVSATHTGPTLTPGAPAVAVANNVHPLNRHVAGLPASILAHALQFGGVCHTLDAACASSLYALKLAADELQSGRADAMLAGGLSRPDCLYTQMGFSQLRALSPTGACSPFDANGNGLVVGEGCGMLLLKRLDDALADGDHVYAVIRGIGLSNDVGGSLLAPLSEGQLRAMRAAYTQAALDPREIDLIECHATGTPVGDAVEFESLKALWAQAEELQIASGIGHRVSGLGSEDTKKIPADEKPEATEFKHALFTIHNSALDPEPETRNPNPESRKCVLSSVKSNIGHLLTAAGSAAVIKVLLALKHRQLPPTANFNHPAGAIRLDPGPFEVLRQARKWNSRGEKIPRRAAVSAFGFGGINAHVLLEEFLPFDDTANHKSVPSSGIGCRVSGSGSRNPPSGTIPSPKPETRNPQAITPDPRPQTPDPIAIVGMAAHFGPWDNLRQFQERVLSGRDSRDPLLHPAWRAVERGAWLSNSEFAALNPQGYFIEELTVALDRYRIPPRELEELLPQQLLMLEVAADAMRDAGLSAMERRLSERAGVFIGLGLDLNTTNFNLRWLIRRYAPEWARALGLKFNDGELREWIEQLCDASGPHLTANRTMGNLGSIAASRVGREFHFGGPCFTLANEDNAGIQALTAALRALRAGELDLALAGAVDLNSDPRAIRAAQHSRPCSPDGRCRPFDQAANGAVPGEGAAALVLKRLSDARRDGNRVYALIQGMGAAAGGDVETGLPDRQTWRISAERALADAGIVRESLQYIEANGSGAPNADRLEAEALAEFFGEVEHDEARVALGSVKADVGHAGAASGLAAVVKTALCLYQEILPPLRGIENPLPVLTQQGESGRRGPFALHPLPRYWLRNRAEGPRRALVANFGVDGGCAHAVLEDYESSNVEGEDPANRLQPLGARAEGLFAIEANNAAALLVGLNRLKTFLDHQTDLHIEALARRWWNENRQDSQKALALALVARSSEELNRQLEFARRSLAADPEQRLGRANGEALEPFVRDRVFYAPQPLGRRGGIAFVFPGSGNHFSGMGRGAAVEWPELLRAQDRENQFLRSQFQPQFFWSGAADEQLGRNHQAAIFGQVALGTVFSDLIQSLGVRPRAVIGYSLGETAGLFALKAWSDRDEMLRRMNASTLFTSDLAGEMNVVRKIWRLPANKTVDWAVGVINRPVKVVRAALKDYKKTFTLIVNTLQECVIGGYKPEIDRLVRKLECEFYPLDGISTVHCQIAEEVAEPYRELHLFPTVEPRGVMFYSGARGASYHVNRESAADSILAQAIHGIDYPKVIEAAWSDEIRIFLEMGPGASCSRMIGEILKDRPHLARSFCVAGQDDVSLVLRGVAALIAERAPVDLSVLYGQQTEVVEHQPQPATAEANVLRVPVGAPPFRLPPPPASDGSEQAGEPQAEFPVMPEARESAAAYRRAGRFSGEFEPLPASAEAGASVPDAAPAGVAALMNHSPAGLELDADFAASPEVSSLGDADEGLALQDPQLRELYQLQLQQAQAHAAYLQFAEQVNQTLTRSVHLQLDALERTLQQNGIRIPKSQANLKSHGVDSESQNTSDVTANVTIQNPDTLYPEPYTLNPDPETRKPQFNRAQCLELATGALGKVLGPPFAEVDAFPTRVRLPDEPLMLVDRVLRVTGASCALTGGGVVTEHDVLSGAWYLDGGRIPTCIAVEAGQADLFLSGWLGIDFVTRGLAVYRLLDATVTFHGPLPRPGATIRYDITIEHFFQHGDTWFFHFQFDGTVNGRPLITMRNGCAGFFTQQELDAGQGVVRSALQQKPQPGKLPPDWQTFAPPAAKKESYSDAQLAELRRGNLAGCFGEAFAELPLADPLRLPDGLLNLVDRVLELDQTGGRCGLGRIRAEMDVHPDDWFLTCHFSDDQVMPGTLMYECCLHTLRIFLLRLGWVGERGAVVCEPLREIASQLKCRGQVIASTKKVLYEVEIRELGWQPDGAPFAVADALMYADGRPIVDIANLCVRFSGLTREQLEEYWKVSKNKSEIRNPKSEINSKSKIPNHRSQESSGIGYRVPGFGATESNTRNPLPETRNPEPKTRNPQFQTPDPRPQTLAASRLEYTLAQLTAFTEGDAVACFGDKYRPLQEQGKYFALLPRRPYQFLHRVDQVDARPWLMRSGGAITGHCELRHDDWHFISNRQDELCYAILLEAVLQPCGFFSAFMGSAFLCDKPLYFRNLGGSATQYQPIPRPSAPGLQPAPDARHESVPASGPSISSRSSIPPGLGPAICTTRVHCTQVANTAEMSIQHFEFCMTSGDEKIYAGKTYFGFFTAAALQDQVGLRDAQLFLSLDAAQKAAADLSVLNSKLSVPPFPDAQLRMIDRIEILSLDGGPHGLGFVRGVKTIDPAEWFFHAHFKGDPVWPGSLGIEAFLQLLKLYACERWNGGVGAQFTAPIPGVEHRWTYRGQVNPQNKLVTVDACITRIDDERQTLHADGLLIADGLPIYDMRSFSLQLHGR